MEIIALFIPILAIIGIVIIVIYLRRFTNEERMAMIDKGISMSDWPANKRSNASWPLRLALLFIGVGLGFLFGSMLNAYANLEEPVAYFSMLFIFGGAGLGLSYIIEEKRAEKE